MAAALLCIERKSQAKPESVSIIPSIWQPYLEPSRIPQPKFLCLPRASRDLGAYSGIMLCMRIAKRLTTDVRRTFRRRCHHSYTIRSTLLHP